MLLQTNAIVVSVDPYEQSSLGQNTLGSRTTAGDAREYTYAKAGASNISKGKLQLSPAQKTNHHNMAVGAAAAIGATEVSVTLGATAAVADEYDEGLLVISVTPGQGQVLRISRNPAIASSGTGTIVLADQLEVALTTSSKANLVHNVANGVVEAAVKTRRAAGVPYIDITTLQFGWLASRGVAAVLADQTITLGAQLSPSGSVAGAVIENADVTAPQAEVIVGQASVMAGVDAEYRPVCLNIA